MGRKSRPTRGHSLQELLLPPVTASFWGDEVVLYTMSAMWGMCITVLNSKIDQEYWICHNMIIDRDDINLVFNVGMHYTAAGGSPVHFIWSPI